MLNIVDFEDSNATAPPLSVYMAIGLQQYNQYGVS